MKPLMPTHDILIIGAGPVGLALALSLKDSGLTVTLVDARDAQASAADPRVIALAHGSRLTLERLGIWQALKNTPIQSIHISHKGGFGRTLLEADQHDLEALGYVCPAGALASALRRAVESAGIQIIDNTRLVDSLAHDDQVECSLIATDGSHTETRVGARLLACAEGGLNDDTPGVSHHDYQQTALIGHVTPAGGHGNRAFERFTPDGPIALLPHGPDFALVHVIPSNRAETFGGLDDATYLEHLQDSFGSRVRLTAVSERVGYPLVLRYRRSTASAETRTVWLGNAAQTLHPVAGQGFNLALRDVIALAEQLLDTPGDPGDPGDRQRLSRFGKSRSLDRFGTIGFTNTLIRSFSNDLPALRHLRGAGLFALDMIPPLSGFVARRMMFGARAWP